MRKFDEYEDYCGHQGEYLFKKYDEFTEDLTDTSLREIRSQVRNQLECPADFINDPIIIRDIRAIQRAVKTGMKPLFTEAMGDLQSRYWSYCKEHQLFYWDDNRRYKPVVAASIHIRQPYEPVTEKQESVSSLI